MLLLGQSYMLTMDISRTIQLYQEARGLLREGLKFEKNIDKI